MGLSVGIGLTNACNLNCAHCYRSTDHIHYLSLETVKQVCDSLPVASVGMGTGENALHPDFEEIVQYLHGRGIRVTMASNGYSLTHMSDQCLQAFHDVEVSVDFPTEREQDAFRGEGNWRQVHTAVERCSSVGVEVSVLATMMSTNFDRMGELARLARSLNANLRVNVYQAVNTDSFKLSYEQFWQGFECLFAGSRLLSCSEPVVRAAIGLSARKSPCGHHSVRITPDGWVIPCVYWPERAMRTADLVALGERVVETPQFTLANRVPDSARDCRCLGGCAGRRILSGKPDSHDEYCPWKRGDNMRLDVEWAAPRELPRSSNVCTTIVT